MPFSSSRMPAAQPKAAPLAHKSCPQPHRAESQRPGGGRKAVLPGKRNIGSHVCAAAAVDQIRPPPIDFADTQGATTIIPAVLTGGNQSPASEMFFGSF